ncbi:MAG: chemotaxis protein [Methylococcales bacterium]
MSSFIQSVDDRTRLAGTNRLEVLMFGLGTDSNTNRNEIYGINVFKVREVMHIPEITSAPDMPNAIEGMVSLRGVMVPVINLPTYCGIQTEEKPNILMITEYNKHIQGFLVHSVDTIKRLNWSDVKVPPSMLVNQIHGLVTAVAEIEEGRMVMIMDVEKVLAETASFYEDESIFDGIYQHTGDSITILFADDSSVARSQITKTLDKMGINHIGLINGAEAWKKLSDLAAQAELSGRQISDIIQIILTDVEMPEMDGYVLTQKIKSDPRFKEIPVIMHSSLSANRALGKSVGADAYVPKFAPHELSTAIKDLISIKNTG